MRSVTVPGKIQECIPVRYINSFQPDPVNAVFTNTGITACSYSNIPSDKEKNEQRIIYQVRYLPGACIVNAVKNRNQKILDSTELAILKAAKPVVAKALQQPAILRRELYIHDVIISMADYDYAYLRLLDKNPAAHGQ